MTRKAKHQRSWTALRALVTIILLFVVSPTVVIVLVSFSSAAYLSFPPPGFSLQWYRAYFLDPVWIDATLQSLRIAATTAMLSLSLGLPLAFGLTRSRFAGNAAIERFVSSPMMVPDIVLSIAIYGLYSTLGLVGRWYGVAVAHTVMTLPLVVVVLVAGLRSYDHSIEVAARGLGASRLRAVWYVTLPILGPSVAAAALLAFVVSVNELVVAIFSAGAVMTFPKKMYEEILTDVEPTVAAASTVQMVVVLMLVFLLTSLTRRMAGRAIAVPKSNATQRGDT